MKVIILVEKDDNFCGLAYDIYKAIKGIPGYPQVYLASNGETCTWRESVDKAIEDIKDL